MRIKKIKVYPYEELEESAKQRVLDKYRDINVSDFEWWDSVYDDFINLCKLIGVQTDHKHIYFSGFSSQGDGACFEGSYSYAKGSCKAIRDYAPKDTELHRIADELYQVQAKNFFRVTATVRQRGHYMHKYCTEIGIGDSGNGETEQAITELLRDLMEWLYRALEREYDYLTSEEVVIQYLKDSGWEFTEEGKLA